MSENLITFCEQYLSGSVSGRVNEWPQIKQLCQAYLETQGMKPPPPARENCFYCDANNVKGFTYCYRCGRWPTIDYSKGFNDPKRTIERRVK